MNHRTALLISGCFLAGSLSAQDITQQVKVDVKSVKVDQQFTPQIQALNVVDKRWRPKTWLEIEGVFDIKLANDLGGKKGSLPSMSVTYFIGLNQKTDEGKNIVLTGTVNYNDVPADTQGIGLAFVSPSTLKRILQKDNGGKNDVQAYGCEVKVGGTRLGFASSTSGPWWFDTAAQGLSDKYSFQDGTILPKAKTPFAPFWGDYDLPVAVP